MHTSVAPTWYASFALLTISSVGRKYPSSSLKSLLNAQKPHCLIHTFVKLIFLLTTYETISPTLFLLISFATRPTR